ncbi:MAG: FAD-dependent oxidoreductase [Beutenbergiaceae bacterium]
MERSHPDQLKNGHFDLVVIGGGITGAATARDAALRGLSVVLVEKDDFAAGTSSRSSKLIHGGLRYLQTYQFGLVAQSLRERERMLTLAPHLTEVSPFLYLLYQGYPESQFILNLGLTFYDLASGQWRKRRHRMLSAEQVLEREPHLRSAGLRGAGQYYDVLTDDARLTMDTVKGAAQAGALMVNHTLVTGLVLESGVARGVRVVDQIHGESYEIRARQVLNATGPWTDQVRHLESSETGASLRPSKGVHIVLKKSDFPLNTPVFLRSPDDGRVVWPTPSLEEDVVYIGTTDTDYTGDIDHVSPDDHDIQYLLNVANHTIPDARLSERHVVGSWAGLRPLVASEPGASTGSTSREHAISTGPAGMLTISGGKLTSSRVMARHLVDAALTADKRRAGRYLAGRTPLSGGATFDRRAYVAASADAGVPQQVARGWLRRYGCNAVEVLSRWQADPDARIVIGPRGLSVAEIRYAVQVEMACTLADLLVRRTSIFFWDAHGGLETIERISTVMAHELGWDEQQRMSEVEAYSAHALSHRPRAEPA